MININRVAIITGGAGKLGEKHAEAIAEFDGKVGQGFNRLINQWSENTGVNIIKQIKDWNAADLGQSSEAPTPYAFK